MHPIYHFCSRKVVQMSSSERVKMRNMKLLKIPNFASCVDSM